MATIAINYSPPMTRYLVKKTDVFRDDPVTIVDVGARWGFNPEWEVFGEHLRVYCFEPDEEECRRLNASAGRNVKYVPSALGRADGEATFYETKLSASSGLYKTNMKYFSRLLNRDNGITVGERTIKLQTLVGALQRFGVHTIDLIKLDVEGAELDVLMGGEPYLQEGLLVGILSEVRFQEEINGCPIFWQLDDYVRRFGFRLYNLQFTHQSRHALPYPSLMDYRTPEGERFFAYTTHGQIMDGDALYFRDLLIPANRGRRAVATPVQLLKMAAFLEIYCFNDCAAELILAHRQQLKEKADCDVLLELLTPKANGKKLSYDDYLKKYFDQQEGIIASPDSARNGHYAELRRIYSSVRRRVGRLSRRLTRFFRGPGRS